MPRIATDTFSTRRQPEPIRQDVIDALLPGMVTWAAKIVTSPAYAAWKAEQAPRTTTSDYAVAKAEQFAAGVLAWRKATAERAEKGQ